MSADKKQAMMDAASETLERMKNSGPKNSATDKAVEARICTSHTLRVDSIGRSQTYVAGSR